MIHVWGVHFTTIHNAVNSLQHIQSPTELNPTWSELLANDSA